MVSKILAWIFIALFLVWGGSELSKVGKKKVAELQQATQEKLNKALLGESPPLQKTPEQ